MIAYFVLCIYHFVVDHIDCLLDSTRIFVCFLFVILQLLYSIQQTTVIDFITVVFENHRFKIHKLRFFKYILLYLPFYGTLQLACSSNITTEIECNVNAYNGTRSYSCMLVWWVFSVIYTYYICGYFHLVTLVV